MALVSARNDLSCHDAFEVGDDGVRLEHGVAADDEAGHLGLAGELRHLAAQGTGSTEDGSVCRNGFPAISHNAWLPSLRHHIHHAHNHMHQIPGQNATSPQHPTTHSQAISRSSGR